MRSILTAAGAAAVLLTVPACAGSGPSAPTTAPVTTTAPAVAASARTGNTVQVCAAVKQVNTTTPTTMTATMKTAVDLASTGDATEQQVTKAFETAGQKLISEAGRWIRSLQAQSSVATDPELATAIDDLATELAPLRTGRGNLQQMKTIAAGAESKLAAWCGGTATLASSTPAVAAGIGPGTACPGLAAFDTAEDWKPEAVSGDSFNSGGRTLLCEIDAKPAGIIGFIRVWSTQDADPRSALKGVVTALNKPTGLRYRRVRAGKLPALEVTYANADGPGRAFAATAPNGEIIVTTWKGFDQEEHEEGLPAYKLARSSFSFP